MNNNVRETVNSKILAKALRYLTEQANILSVYEKFIIFARKY